MTEKLHQPVMVQEVVELLQPRPGDTIVDLNVGTGGHSLALLEACGGKGYLVGLDLDDAMLSLARQRLDSRGFPSRSYALVQANHADLVRVLGALNLESVDRIAMDLGASSLHLDDPLRGFSLQSEGPLDMRYDRSGDLTAAEIVNTWPENDLTKLFRDKGDERWARRIAKRLIERRNEKPLETTTELAQTVAGAIPRKAWPPKIHPATRVFLALRVEVNAEDESLKQALAGATQKLKVGGRMAVLTFQSHEDRTVKRTFREICRDVIDENDPFGRVQTPAAFRDLTRKPMAATSHEVEVNPRARSAKLRAVEKIRQTE
ncbi:16S rRNA (cytosine(1402)-N(4))-methyltransferase RsmH [bacterium]|nr:16S rRNA (cytosine(1402)-N(4))-methyltransferase RsmH [bacterium]